MELQTLQCRVRTARRAQRPGLAVAYVLGSAIPGGHALLATANAVKCVALAKGSVTVAAPPHKLANTSDNSVRSGQLMAFMVRSFRNKTNGYAEAICTEHANLDRAAVSFQVLDFIGYFL